MKPLARFGTYLAKEKPGQTNPAQPATKRRPMSIPNRSLAIGTKPFLGDGAGAVGGILGNPVLSENESADPTTTEP